MVRYLLSIVLCSCFNIYSMAPQHRVEEMARAAVSGNLPEIQRLVRMGYSVGGVSDAGYTPLMYAAVNGHGGVVDFFIKYGIDVNEDTPTHVSALFAAVLHDDYPCAEMLILAGADINKQTESGKTPLHLAAMHGNTELIWLLCLFGADPNVSAGDGSTALGYALEHNHYFDAVLLIALGAQPSQQDLVALEWDNDTREIIHGRLTASMEYQIACRGDIVDAHMVIALARRGHFELCKKMLSRSRWWFEYYPKELEMMFEWFVMCGTDDQVSYFFDLFDEYSIFIRPLVVKLYSRLKSYWHRVAPVKERVVTVRRALNRVASRLTLQDRIIIKYPQVLIEFRRLFNNSRADAAWPESSREEMLSVPSADAQVQVPEQRHVPAAPFKEEAFLGHRETGLVAAE